MKTLANWTFTIALIAGIWYFFTHNGTIVSNPPFIAFPTPTIEYKGNLGGGTGGTTERPNGSTDLPATQQPSNHDTTVSSSQSASIDIGKVTNAAACAALQEMVKNYCRVGK